MINNKKIQQLDLNLLRVFQTLFVEQNMTRTAEVLHLTPSAVSHAVKRLRYTLDDPLFVRSQNKMLPTLASQRMAPAIIDTLSRLQQILQQWGEFEPLTSTHNFKIGMHDAFEPSIVPKLASKLNKLAPNVTFSSIKFDRTNLLKELATGYIDVALDVALVVKKPIHTTELIENEFVVMMRKNHPLANNLNKQNYLSADHLNVSNRPSGFTIEDSMFRKQGLDRTSTIRCQSYFAAKEIVKNSDQLLTVSSLMAEQLIDEKIIQIPVPIKLPSFDTSLYWHSNTEEDAALRWLRKVLLSLF